MSKLTYLIGVLLVIPCGVTVACPGDGARCDGRVMLADAHDYDASRYLESDDGVEHGPLSVHVTTFDGSPATPGVWYERPRRPGDEEAPARPHDLPVAPFDRQLFDRESR